MAADAANFVERDYRHVESDVVLLAPLRRRQGQRPESGACVFLGATEAAQAAGLEVPADIPNAFVIEPVGESLFILGDDSDGPAFWVRYHCRPPWNPVRRNSSLYTRSSSSGSHWQAAISAADGIIGATVSAMPWSRSMM